MSFWYYKKEKGGKTSLTAVDIPVLLIMSILGFFVALVGPRIFGSPSQLVIDAFHIIAVGFSLLFISKVSMFMKGIWVSWGYSRMPKLFKLFYMLGYILIGIGLFGFLVVYKTGQL